MFVSLVEGGLLYILPFIIFFAILDTEGFQVFVTGMSRREDYFQGFFPDQNCLSPSHCLSCSWGNIAQKNCIGDCIYLQMAKEKLKY